MKTLNAWRMFWVCIFVFTLSSCGDDVYYTLENNDNDLCNKLWITNYTTDEGLTGTCASIAEARARK